MTNATTRNGNGNHMRELQREIEQMLAARAGYSHGYATSGSSAGGSMMAGNRDGNSTWSPAVDVVETQHEIVLHAELPGMKKEDIDIQLTGDTLTIRGERECAQNKSGENFHRIERQYGRFGRTFQIETPIDGTNVAASYEEGVLTVRLPKQESVKPRHIEIKTA